MEKKSKTGAIIGTVAASLLCGCPGLVACPFGIAILAGAWKYDIEQWIGIFPLCLSPIFIAIPIAIGVATLRNKKVAEPVIEGLEPPQEPLPPAS